ncbi:MAG TPA: GNAT family N-acetyltransferase [Terriglobia bacterium]|nr:GNAT family N-acetyltransferase [Terriglobia bacterium]
MKTAIHPVDSLSGNPTDPLVGTGVAASTRWGVELDQVSPEEWDGMLEEFADANFYQSRAYGAVRWGERNLSHIVLRRDGEAAAIAQLRIYRPLGLPFGMAYLRWGPLFHRRGRAADAEAAGRMARALREEYAGKRKLYLRVLPNAFAGTERARLFREAFPQYLPERHHFLPPYRTLLLDLTPSGDELHARLSARWRRQLARAERIGLAVLCGTDAATFRRFVPIYREMHRRKGFYTTVRVEEFASMQEALPERHRMRVLLCEEAGKIVAGIVVAAMGDTALYLLGATSDQGLNSRGSYLLHWTVMQRLKEEGFRYYDLGGIDPRLNPGGYDFKKGLGGAEAEHLPGLGACESASSRAAVQAGELLRGAVYRCRQALRRGGGRT